MAHDDKALRQHLARILDWQDAHATFDAAVDGVPHAKRGVVPHGLAHSVWQLLEHIRLAQWDILDFCVNPQYVEPTSMDEYWPAMPAPPSEAAWDESVAAVRRDRDAMKQLALKQEDLFVKIPHGSGQTYLREILLVADHSAYHVGQIVLVRRALGIWG
jgi:DinB superfamily